MNEDKIRCPGLTTRLADHVSKVANSRLTSDDIEALRRLFLDTFIVALWGSTRPCASQIAAWSKRYANTGNSIVLGANWTTDPSISALVFGTAAHSYELDDTHDVTTSHPGCVVIAAALAVAAETNASQEDLFRAVATGYEAMALIGSAAGGLPTVHRGFHPTAVFGSFGAATACVSLRAYQNKEVITRDLLLKGWGHALSQACGSMQFSVEPTGGEVKRVHAGLGARNGVLAADFTLLPDVTAPLQSVEGTYGVAAIFGGPLNDVVPDERLQIHTISFKPYSCCRLFHSTIDALSEVTDGFAVAADKITDILITGPQLIADQHMTRAESTMTAQYSCPYIVGATLAYGPTRYDAYGESFLNDRRILDISDKVRFKVDPEMEKKYYPKQFATGVEMRFKDRPARTTMVVDSFGTARKPMSVEQIIAKGDGLASQGNYPKGAALADTIWSNADGLKLAQAVNRRWQ